MLSMDSVAEKIPEIFPDIYRELFDFRKMCKDLKRQQESVERFILLLKRAPAGRYYTESLKASVLSTLQGFIEPKVQPKSLKKHEGVKKTNISTTVSKLLEALNAIELDWRVPTLSTKKVKAGKYSAVDFQGVAWVSIRDIKKSGKISMSVESGLPALAEGGMANPTRK
jgi:hypothetical protein